jgi:VanZ family protein
LLLAATVALLDEVYQSLVPGRMPQWQDALMDLWGFVCGFGCSMIVTRIAEIRRQASSEGKS